MVFGNLREASVAIDLLYAKYRALVGDRVEAIVLSRVVLPLPATELTKVQPRLSGEAMQFTIVCCSVVKFKLNP